MKKYLQKLFINILVKHLYKWDNTSEVLELKNGKYFINGVEMKKQDLFELKKQAEAILALDVFNLVTQEYEKLAQKQIFIHSKSADDIFFGKVMLYTLDIVKKRIEFFSRM